VSDILGVLSLQCVHMYQCWHGIGNLSHESREKKRQHGYLCR
jgi:hypothetical protein